MNQSLKDIQAWVYDVITHEHSVEAGEANTRFTASGWGIEALITPSATLNSHERISIYRDSYFLRLLECFKHEYRGLHQAVGEQLFKHFAWNYLLAYPPQSYTLHELGKHFPAYLQQSLDENLQGAPADNWQLFILDLARYERLMTEVFMGEGHEDLHATDPFPTTAIRLSPALRLLELRFPIAAIRAHKESEILYDELTPEKTFYAFTRDHYQVRVHPLVSNEFEALQQWLAHPDQVCNPDYQEQWLRKKMAYHVR